MGGLDKKDVSVGMRVQDGNANVGTVRWIGRMEKNQKPPEGDVGTYCAVEFDTQTAALHRSDGVWESQRYCQSPPGTVEFLKPRHLMREMCRSSVLALRDKYKDLVGDWHDEQLVKFLIARQFDMPKVMKMIEDNVKWNQEFKPSPEEFFPPEMAESYPLGFGDGADRDGNLLYFERPGNGGFIHPKDFVKKFTIPVIVRWHAAAMEMGRMRMKASGYASKRVTAIVDLKGFGDTDSGVISFAKAIAKVDQDNYPEHLAKMYIINAPGFFTGVWKLIRFFVDDRTKAKIHVLGENFQESLKKQVDPKYWPSFAGGTDDSWLKNGGVCGGKDPLKAAAQEASARSNEELHFANESDLAAAKAAAEAEDNAAAQASREKSDSREDPVESPKEEAA